MTDEAITIVAKAIAKDMGLAYPKFLAEKHAVAALGALRAAGYWVERWRPIEGRPHGHSVIIAADEIVGEACIDGVGDWRWKSGGYVIDDPVLFTHLPPPPVQSEGGDG